MRTHTDNFQRGLDILAKIDPENYEDIMAGFEQSALPDLGTLAVEFNYGQIFETRLRLKVTPSCYSGWPNCIRQYGTAKILYKRGFECWVDTGRNFRSNVADGHLCWIPCSFKYNFDSCQ